MSKDKWHYVPPVGAGRVELLTCGYINEGMTFDGWLNQAAFDEIKHRYRGDNLKPSTDVEDTTCTSNCTMM